MENPLEFITYWDLLLVTIGVILRFLVVVKYKQKEFKGNFDIKVYFDTQHIIRWVIHLSTALAGLLVLPQLFVGYIFPKYFPEITEWFFTASCVLGFVGYDLIKYVEKLTFKIINKT